MDEDLLTIGKLAQRVKLNLHTIRYYEKAGLIAPAAYRDSGYRLYDSGALRRIQFIRNAVAFEFSIREIAALLTSSLPGQSCARLHRLVERKLEQMQRRMERLGEGKKELERLLRSCRSSHRGGECPIAVGLSESRARRGVRVVQSGDPYRFPVRRR